MYYRFDKDGYYIEPVAVEYFDESNETIPDDITNIRPADGLYRAKWTGSEWIETGEPQENEVENENEVGQNLSLDEKVEQLEILVADLYSKSVQNGIISLNEVPDVIAENVNRKSQDLNKTNNI